MLQLTGFSGFSDADSALADPSTNFANLISNVVGVMTIFAGIAFTFWFIMGAFTWITGGHDPAQVDKAKRQLSTGIIGLIFTAAAIPIAYLVGEILGIKITAPEQIIPNLLPK